MHRTRGGEVRTHAAKYAPAKYARTPMRPPPAHARARRPPSPPPHRLGDSPGLWPVNLNLDDLAFDDFRLLLDAHADGLSEGLRTAGGAGRSAGRRPPFNAFNAMISIDLDPPPLLGLPPTCVRASVLDISREKISEAAIMANGVSSPSALAMPIAMAVLPVPGWPASSTARPAILPSLIICRMTPAACIAGGGGASGAGGTGRAKGHVGGRAARQEPQMQAAHTHTHAASSSNPPTQHCNAGIPPTPTHLARPDLPDHALGHVARFQRIVQAQASDVRVRADALNPREVADLRGHLDVACRHGAAAAWGLGAAGWRPRASRRWLAFGLPGCGRGSWRSARLRGGGGVCSRLRWFPCGFPKVVSPSRPRHFARTGPHRGVHPPPKMDFGADRGVYFDEVGQQQGRGPSAINGPVLRCSPGSPPVPTRPSRVGPPPPRTSTSGF